MSRNIRNLIAPLAASLAISAALVAGGAGTAWKGVQMIGLDRRRPTAITPSMLRWPRRRVAAASPREVF